MKRKIWALLMSAALILSYLPAMAFADDTLPDDTEEQATEVNDEDLESNSGNIYLGSGVSTPVPTKVSFSGGGLYGPIGSRTIENLYTRGQSFIVTFSDGSTKEYLYDKYSYKDNNGKTVTREGFLAEGEDPSSEASYLEAFANEEDTGSTPVFKEGENKVKIQVKAPYEATDDDGVTDTYWETLYTDVFIWCSGEKPVSIKFVPAKGNKLTGYVGYNYIDESFFYGKGNAFVVTIQSLTRDADGTDTIAYECTYEYTKVKEGNNTVEGFFYFNPDTRKYERLDVIDEPVEAVLKKGSNKVTLPFTAYAEGRTAPIRLSFTVTVNAGKYYTYGNWPIFNYTGKNLSKKKFAKKLVIRDSDDNKIPASAYTFKWKKHKKMGWYTVQINFKDKNKYESPLTVDYGIGPKKPKLTKVKGGKKLLKVYWKRFSKKQLKKIDYMTIEIAQDKNFTQGYKSIKISKKKLKYTNGWRIKKLKGNKKYYVRLCTYKKIKQGGETFMMFSDYSKIKKAKVRK